MLTRALTSVVAAGIVLAAALVWRLLERSRARWLVVVLGAYGAIGFLHATYAGISVSAALAGDGLFQPLPRLLRAASVGAFVVLPIGWIAAIVRAGIPRLREGAPGRNVYQAVALTTCVGMVLTLMPREQPRGTNAAAYDERGAMERIAALSRRLKAVEEAERDAPRDRWDPDYVVGVVGRDPQALAGWVRDNTLWIPYRGSLRGPIGVLMDRQGNSLDRARLLATLLKRAGHEVRLAHGHLTRDAAAARLPDLIVRRAQTPVPAEWEAADPTVQRVASQDRGVLLRGRQAADRLSSELDDRVVDQTARLLAGLDRPDAMAEWRRRFDQAVDALRDCWWVQRRDGSSWVDVSELDEDGASGAAPTAVDETLDADALPEAVYHTFAVRVVAEQWSDGTLSQHQIFEYAVRPSEVFGQPIVLQFWPGAWQSTLAADPRSAAGLKGVALDQDKWIGLLSINNKTVAHGILGRTADNDQSTVANNPFAALAGAAGAAFQSRRPAPVARELTAVWIEYEIRAPDEAPRSIRRMIVDLLEPGSRSAGAVPRPTVDDATALKRSLALMMRTEILPLAAEMAPEFVAHLAAESLVRDRPQIERASRPALPSSTDGVDEDGKLLGESVPPLGPLYTLAMLRSTWGSREVLVDRLNLLTRHQYPAVVHDAFTFRDDIDIVMNDVGVDLGQPDAFPIRVAHGVFDTNAEALIARPAIVVDNTGEAFTNPGEWTALTPQRHERALSLNLSERRRHRIEAGLAEGQTIVLPTRAVTVAGEPFTGWWQVDPAVGTTLGVGENGWGVAAVDFAVVLQSVATFAHAFAFEYAMCQVIPGAVNTLKYLGTVRTSDTVGRVSQDMQGVIQSSIKENNHGCLVWAIASGALATLPLVILTIKYSRIPRRLAPIRRFEAVAEARPRVPEPPLGGKTEAFEIQQPRPGKAKYSGPERYLPQSRIKPPPGEGAYQYQFDSDTLQLMRDVPDHPLVVALGKTEWYEQANAAARSAYNEARAAGSAEQAARQASYEAYKVYFNQARGNVLQLGGLNEIPTGKGGVTVPLVLAGALIGFIPDAVPEQKPGS